MSSKGSEPRLQIECGHQRVLRTLFLSCVIMGSVCLLAVPLSWPLTGFSLSLLYGAAWHVWRTRCELGGAVASVLWDGEGRWWWYAGGEETELLLCGDSYLSTWLIVLNLRHPVTGRSRSLLLFPSGVRGDLFRRLTVRLRLEGRA